MRTSDDTQYTQNNSRDGTEKSTKKTFSEKMVVDSSDETSQFDSRILSNSRSEEMKKGEGGGGGGGEKVSRLETVDEHKTEIPNETHPGASAQETETESKETKTESKETKTEPKVTTKVTKAESRETKAESTLDVVPGVKARAEVAESVVSGNSNGRDSGDGGDTERKTHALSPQFRQRSSAFSENTSRNETLGLNPPSAPDTPVSFDEERLSTNTTPNVLTSEGEGEGEGEGSWSNRLSPLYGEGNEGKLDTTSEIEGTVYMCTHTQTVYIHVHVHVELVIH